MLSLLKSWPPLVIDVVSDTTVSRPQHQAIIKKCKNSEKDCFLTILCISKLLFRMAIFARLLVIKVPCVNASLFVLCQCKKISRWFRHLDMYVASYREGSLWYRTCLVQWPRALACDEIFQRQDEFVWPLNRHFKGCCFCCIFLGVCIISIFIDIVIYSS